MIKLTNTWMNDPTFLAQSAHFFSALTVVMTCAYFWNKPGAWVAAISFLLLAGVKKFWYDLKYELPTQTFWDSALDFSFYAIGLVVAMGLVLLK